MIGKRSTQMPLFDVGNVFALHLAPGSFHAQLAEAAPRLFSDADFATFYHASMGRPSVAPSLLALTLLLQHEAGVSDEEAIARTAYDLRWCAVLRKEAAQALCAKSTLQLFRAHLILHPKVQTIFLASIKEAKRSGLLQGNALRIALDTKPIRGRGAVQDTFNLLGAGIRQLARALAKEAKQTPEAFLREHGLDRYSASSLKGSADIDWSDETAKTDLLTTLLTDAKHLLVLCLGAPPQVREAASLLQQLLLQDIEEKQAEDGSTLAQVKEGTVAGRVPSATDPDIRHGRKSASKRFNGHKADVATDTDTQIIVAFDVLPGDAPDAKNALAMVEAAEENTQQSVEQTSADCAYGGGPTRQAFAEAGRDLLAKVPQEASRNGLFAKSAFDIDLEQDSVTCPGGHTTKTFHSLPNNTGRVFSFGALCRDCPLRSACTTSGKGRTLLVHPQEALLQAARAYQQTPQGRARLRERVVVEHRLARLSQLGISQALYLGRVKTRFQLMMASSIANFRRVWNWEAAHKQVSATAQTPLEASGGSDFSERGFVRACFGLLLSFSSYYLQTGSVGRVSRRIYPFTVRLAA
jgi:hypothetical protein